ncbi:polyprenyl synthetase family protein [Pleomorphomonas carboxyditropha]|uniref:Probable farnesyl diphosphate synthase n=1 Tax=Pleomorphomonas carboxyditropha TaxID=2023338 RepID=A0A2G9WVS9_9HYPH|nr:polyprenyl synthetase family protein [Pleomorphomonas carboxyditropha]PIO98412.1 geranylgeranyl pyrophosphate synthase [Pleomorphomonas carboxyditropha]
MTAAFEAALADFARALEAGLAARLGAAPRPGEIARPARLLAAMRHAVLAGGKRLRPFLLAEVARLLDPGLTVDALMPAAAAIECLHCYSLVHDDLPAMDDDALRRGRPTVHVAYDEATAILAGDGLLTLAFDLLADPACHADPAVRAALVLDLARAGGLGGMVGGQMLDLAAEGRFGDGAAPGEAGIRELQAMKTGALIRAATVMGARLGGAGEDELRRFGRFGDILGLAFQLADDLLDVTATEGEMGKAVAKDAAHGKGTLIALLGIDAVRAELDRLVAEATELLAPWGRRSETLAAAARFVAERRR